MKASRRCPKCQGTRLLVTDLRLEAWERAAGGTLGVRDHWYEEWTCDRCAYTERYRHGKQPPGLRVDAVVEAPGGETPYR